MNALPVYLLSIRGKLASAQLEQSCSTHNATAGSPEGVAAAKSLGDLSHMVYVPMDPGSAGQLLILDTWNNMDGLNQFFANPQVQEQAGQIFADRDPVVWAPSEGLYTYHFPAPFGKTDRLVGTVRGMVRSRAEAESVHNALVSKLVNKSRGRGNLSHETYYRLTPPGTPESLEFFAVDTWADAAGMAEHYGDPEFLSAFGNLFAGMPDAAVWTHPAGQWVEW